jgi:hypothetical protein
MVDSQIYEERMLEIIEEAAYELGPIEFTPLGLSLIEVIKDKMLEAEL